MSQREISKTILVLGGTGHFGEYIVNNLVEKQVPVRVLSRNPNNARTLFDQSVDIVKGDILEPGSLKKILKDVGGIIVSISAMTPKLIRKFRAIELDGIKHLIDLSVSAKIKRFVYLSVFDPNHPLSKELKLESAAVKREVEEYLAKSNLNWTVLGLAPSREIFFAMLRGNKLVIPGGGPPKLPTVSPLDVGEIASRAVLRDDLGGLRFRVVSQEPISFKDAAEHLGAFFGKPIRLIRLPLKPFIVAGKLAKIFKPISNSANFISFMLDHLNLLNRFPQEIVFEIQNDSNRLLETFKYQSVSFEEEIRKRYSTSQYP